MIPDRSMDKKFRLDLFKFVFSLMAAVHCGLISIQQHAFMMSYHDAMRWVVHADHAKGWKKACFLMRQLFQALLFADKRSGF